MSAPPKLAKPLAGKVSAPPLSGKPLAGAPVIKSNTFRPRLSFGAFRDGPGGAQRQPAA